MILPATVVILVGMTTVRVPTAINPIGDTSSVTPLAKYFEAKVNPNLLLKETNRPSE